MAISQVSKGVYVVSPAQVKKYKDTAAGEYTSVFTKERAKQWELAQKQALMNIEVGSERYKQEMLAYRDRVKALDDQLLANQKDASDVRAGLLTASDRARIAAARAVQDEEKARARREELQARTATYTKGGTTTSTSTGTSTGTGGAGAGARAPAAPKVSDTDRQEIGGAIRESGGDPLLAVQGVESRRTGGTLVGGSEALSDAQNVTLIESLVDARVAESGADRRTAKADILTELDDNGKGYIVDSVMRAEAPAAPDTGGAGGPRTSTSTRTTTSTRAGQGFYKPYAGLGELPALTAAEEEAVLKSMAPADRTPELEFLALQRADLAKKRAALAAPTAPQFDFITQARDIAAGRFGPTQPSPAYRERLVTQGLLTAPEDVRAELLRQYRAVPAAAPITPPSAVPEGVAAPAPTAPATESKPEVELPLRERLLLADMGRELAVPVSDKSMLETLAATTLTSPARLTAPPSVSTMRQPELVVAPTPPINIDTSRAAELALLGVKPEGELVVPAGDKGEPSTAGSVKDIRPLELPGRSPLPATPKKQLEQAEAADRFATSVEKADAARVASKSSLTPEILGVKKGGPPSKVTYLQNRIETALDLKTKPSKLERLTASGSGKVARDLYRANAAKGIPFQRTWEEITMTFNGNEDAMKKAHEIALALDMMTNDTAPKEK